MGNTAGEEPTFLGLGAATWKLACGFGLHVAWISCIFYQGSLFSAVGSSGDWYWYYLLSMGALVAALLVFAFVRPKKPSVAFFSNRNVALAFAAVVAAGSLMVCAAGLDSALGIAVYVASALMTGVGSAYVNVMWGRLFVHRRETRAIVVLCLAYALSAFVYYAVSHLPTLLFVACVVGLPLGSVACAIRAGLAAESVDVESTTGWKDELVAHDLRFFSHRLLVAAFLFGCVQGAMQGIWAVAPSQSTPAVLEHSMLVMLFLSLPLFVAIVYMETGRLQSSHADRFVVVYRVALLTMIGALLVGVVYGTSNPVLLVAMLAGYTFFKVVVWAELCQMCRASGASPTRMFGFGEALMTLALLVSNAGLSQAVQALLQHENAVRPVVALCVAVLLVTYLFVFTERQIFAIEEINEIEDSPQLHTRFQDRLDEIARTFGLTKREAEVLCLFVRGRSTSRIAEDLYVSSGTVATHLRNIYRKANVHSRQELLDLIDAQKSPQATGAVRGEVTGGMG